MDLAVLLAFHMLVAQTPAHEDCLRYNSQTLRLEQERSGLWLLTDGGARMMQFGSKQDAENGLALAQRYTQHCFIGRHNSTRPYVASADARRRLIVHYWKDPTGRQTRITEETCQSYVGSMLRAEDHGNAGWLVTDDKSFRLAVDDITDANAVIVLARQYSAHCIVGTGDAAPPVRSVDYWK